MRQKHVLGHTCHGLDKKDTEASIPVFISTFLSHIQETVVTYSGKKFLIRFSKFVNRDVTQEDMVDRRAALMKA